MVDNDRSKLDLVKLLQCVTTIFSVVAVANPIFSVAGSLIRVQNFDREEQILSQYEKFQDCLNANPKFKEKKMEKFLSNYENTDADLNLDALYGAVTGDNISGNPIMEIMVSTEQWSRRAVEHFCARLKKLFLVGIIAAMSYASLKEGFVGDEMVKKWQGRMEDVGNRMKSVVGDKL
uniref:Rapunzel 5 n=1 Tax=Hucho hucho TaxID=62062 RepID=A0A4W5Q6Z2_9TELE